MFSMLSKQWLIKVITIQENYTHAKYLHKRQLLIHRPNTRQYMCINTIKQMNNKTGWSNLTVKCPKIIRPRPKQNCPKSAIYYLTCSKAVKICLLKPCQQTKQHRFCFLSTWIIDKFQGFLNNWMSSVSISNFLK